MTSNESHLLTRVLYLCRNVEHVRADQQKTGPCEWNTDVQIELVSTSLSCSDDYDVSLLVNGYE